MLEERSIGADVILLIASLLNAREIKHLSSLAHSLGMEVLVEIHKEEEIALIPTDVSLLGINNRNLENFRTDISVSKNLGPKLRDNYTLISESGISRPGQAALLRDYGFSGFLIGTGFMKTPDPGKSLEKFIKQSDSLVYETH